MKELHSLTISLTNLHDALPALVSTRPSLDSGYYPADQELETEVDSRELYNSERTF